MLSIGGPSEIPHVREERVDNLTEAQKGKLNLLAPGIIWEDKLERGFLIVSQPYDNPEKDRDSINANHPNLAQVIEISHDEGQPLRKGLSIESNKLEKINVSELEKINNRQKEAVKYRAKVNAAKNKSLGGQQQDAPNRSPLSHNRDSENKDARAVEGLPNLPFEIALKARIAPIAPQQPPRIEEEESDWKVCGEIFTFVALEALAVVIACLAYKMLSPPFQGR